MVPGSEKRWLIPALIVLGGLCLLLVGTKLGPPAGALAQLRTDSHGEVLVIPVQIERDTYGIAMVDKIGQTLWVYELNSRGPAHNRLKLLAARSWQYDKLLQQYNTAEPKPEQVKILLETLGQPPEQPTDSARQGSKDNATQTTESELP